MISKKLNTIFSILLCLLIIFLFPARAYADDKEYRVDQADFHVELEENGDAVITEKWDLTFTKGSFSRFYKDIYKDVTRLEQFSELDILKVKINGIECEATDSSERIDYHYLYEENRKTNTFNWYLNTRNASVSYEVTYRLKDMVKETDNHTALFCYCFIGANFPKTVKDTKVTIIPPNHAEAEVRYSKADTVNVNDDKIVFSKRKVSGVLKYHIAMDASHFEGLSYIPLKTIKSEERHSAVGDGFSAFFAHDFALVLSAVVLFFSVSGIGHAVKTCYADILYKKALKKNPNYFKSLENELVERKIHPVLFASIHNKKISLFSVFTLFLLELCRKGKCCIDKDTLLIAKDSSGLSGIEEKLISSMNRHFSHEETANDYRFSLSLICALWNDGSKKENFIHDLNNIWSEFQADLQKETASLPAFKKKAILLKRYFKNKVPTNTYECFSLVERTHHIDYLTILRLIYLRPVKTDTEAQNPLHRFCRELDYLIYKEPARNAKDSSCSSCSSCSGCGGGGAD